MSKPLDDFVRDRYLEFITSLDSWGISKKEIPKVNTELKAVYKRYLSIGCVATLAGEKRKRNEFIQGLIEAAQLCIILALKGSENACCVILRQNIELALKHIYFTTHPVEYEWVTSHEGYRELTFQKLMDFWIITPEYRVYGTNKYLYTSINEWYGVLSRHVHVHSKRFIEYSKISRVGGIDPEGLRKLNERTRQVWPLLTVILAAHSKERFLRASVSEKKLIRDSLPQKYKDALDSYLYR